MQFKYIEKFATNDELNFLLDCAVECAENTEEILIAYAIREIKKLHNDGKKEKALEIFNETILQLNELSNVKGGVQ